MEGKIVLGMAVLSVCFCIALIALLIVRAKKTGVFVEKRRVKKVGSVVLCIFMAIIMVANFVVYRFSNVINQYFTTVDLDDAAVKEVRAAGEELGEEIEDEGIVLLKNENNSLPLENKKVNVFGYTSIDINYGGVGSGSGGEAGNIKFYQGLENAGIETNGELKTLYEDAFQSREKVNVMDLKGADYNNFEPSVDVYTDKVIESAKKFSDTALVVLTRSGGEGSDLPLDTANYVGGAEGEHYLELNKNERDMLNLVEANFDNIIIVINSSNVMELGFVEEEPIDAAIWVGGPGGTGCNSIGKVLLGEVNPSGRLADTYAYDVTSNPSYYNFGHFLYENTENQDHLLYFTNPEVFNEDHYMYVDYAEGIYIGYRFYETRWIDNETGECDEKSYKEAVQYPFGYGLSYTEFSQEITNIDENGENVTVEVKVTNTGKEAGKDVVQIYYTAPYYIGGIEKSYVNLLDFEKTGVLQPGKSETVKIEFSYEDMASYDYENNQCYVLEHGDYEIKLMNNAHDLIDSRLLTVDEDVIYNDDNVGARSSDEITAVNRFDDISTGNDVEYVSRADWEGTLPTERPKNKDATKEIVEGIENPPVEENGEEDIIFENHGLSLDDVKGLDYDDSKWDDLLEQISVKEMENLIAYGGYATQEIDSINKRQTSDVDGPAGVNNLVSGDVKGIRYPTEVVIASTWNKELAERYGEVIGKEAAAYGISGLYAPAMNTHRSPFGGRNYEYYSEDSVLAGKIAAAFVRGAYDSGIYCYMKHFALDDQESYRHGLCVWSTEQAIREIYLKPFELAAKEGGITAAMVSDCRIGTTWCGDSNALLNTVLRDEWGFDGMVITDYVVDDYKNGDNAIRNGCDLMLTTTGLDVSKSGETPEGRQALRTATHNILYTVVNSDAQSISDDGFPMWVLLLVGLDIVVYGVAIIIIMKITGKRKEELVESASK